MSLKREEIQQLKKEHAEKTKWLRQAASYLVRYGNSGSLEAREKHAARTAEAERRLPVIEEKLRGAWRDD
jgi:hypothetical protein